MTATSKTNTHHRNAAEIAAAALVLTVTAVFYGLVFNRETTLSYSIGYNLYAAERLLEGELPYRDFHTLYPPATLYANAGIFWLLGINLYWALAGVAVFKMLAVLVLYACGRTIMPRGWAVAAALLASVWLRPNGPFKAVPMHYGALFLALGLLAVLRNERSNKRLRLVLGGAALGLLTLFKHNIGAYAVGGVALLLLLDWANRRLSVNPGAFRRIALLAAGFAIPVLPVLACFQAKGALGAMTSTLLFGPGEFLISRLAAIPSPFVALMLISGLVLLAYAGHLLRQHNAGSVVWFAAIAAASGLVLLSPQQLADALLFYTPVAVLGTGLGLVVLSRGVGPGKHRTVLFLFVFTAAAFMETFPRFAREQVIAAMPFVSLMMLYLLYESRVAIERLAGTGWRLRFATAVAPLLFILMAGRLLATTYLARGVQWKSDTLADVTRCRGVYFPKTEADEISSVVSYIQSRVPADGYFFAQSYTASAYLFLAARRNPSAAQFWAGVGVSPEAKAGTLAALADKNVQLVVTSDKDLAAETYKPLRDYLEQHFQPTHRFGEVLVLERVVRAPALTSIR